MSFVQASWLFCSAQWHFAGRSGEEEEEGTGKQLLRCLYVKMRWLCSNKLGFWTSHMRLVDSISWQGRMMVVDGQPDCHVHSRGGSRGPLGWMQRLPNPERRNYLTQFFTSILIFSPLQKKTCLVSKTKHFQHMQLSKRNSTRRKMMTLIETTSAAFPAQTHGYLCSFTGFTSADLNNIFHSQKNKSGPQDVRQ